MGEQINLELAYKFLREKARSGDAFTSDDFAVYMGFSGQTSSTYLSKLYKAYLLGHKVFGGKNGQFKVLAEFQRVSWDEFQERVTQVRFPFASYRRTNYQSVVVYEFLMPLTREDKLRRALDELFFRDTLECRLEEIGVDVLRTIIAQNAGEDEVAYKSRIIDFIDQRIGGFSISHVSGRYRGDGILSRTAAAERIAGDKLYLIDETTAVVRFIIPCQSTRNDFAMGWKFDENGQSDANALEQELRQIRGIFFEVFVEGLVPSIRGEKLIWLLETSPKGEQLYELHLISPNVEEIDDDDER
jgi:hypothetical protein